MLDCKYTATLHFNNHDTIASYGNNLRKLIINALIHLECDNNYVTGEIRDNVTGKIIHTCRKMTKAHNQVQTLQ